MVPALHAMALDGRTSNRIACHATANSLNAAIAPADKSVHSGTRCPDKGDGRAWIPRQSQLALTCPLIALAERSTREARRFCRTIHSVQLCLRRREGQSAGARPAGGIV